jgi:glucose-1-phosphate cytidylyltransferase
MTLPDKTDIPVVILCGGMGTRLREASEKLPKPLVDIGGKPILWHIMKTYGDAGYRRFILCLGYKGDQIKRWFSTTAPARRTSRCTWPTGHRQEFHNSYGEEDWEVTFAETGCSAARGPAAAHRALPGDGPETFMATYGDGIGASTSRPCSRPTSRRAARHGHGGAPRRAGTASARDANLSAVSEFNVKPTMADGWVSAASSPSSAASLSTTTSTTTAGPAAVAPPLQTRGGGRPARCNPHEGLLDGHGHLPRLDRAQRGCGTAAEAPWKVGRRAAHPLATTCPPTKENLCASCSPAATGYLGCLLGPDLSRRPRRRRRRHRLLQDGLALPGVDRTVYTIDQDVRRLTVEDLRGFDAVVHMAELSNDPLGDLIGTSLRRQPQGLGPPRHARKKAGVERFVYMSSCSVYGVADGVVGREHPPSTRRPPTASARAWSSATSPRSRRPASRRPSCATPPPSAPHPACASTSS